VNEFEVSEKEIERVAFVIGEKTTSRIQIGKQSKEKQEKTIKEVFFCWKSTKKNRRKETEMWEE